MGVPFLGRIQFYLGYKRGTPVFWEIYGLKREPNLEKTSHEGIGNLGGQETPRSGEGFWFRLREWKDQQQLARTDS